MTQPLKLRFPVEGLAWAQKLKKTLTINSPEIEGREGAMRARFPKEMSAQQMLGEIFTTFIEIAVICAGNENPGILAWLINALTTVLYQGERPEITRNLHPSEKRIDISAKNDTWSFVAHTDGSLTLRVSAPCSLEVRQVNIDAPQGDYFTEVTWPWVGSNIEFNIVCVEYCPPKGNIEVRTIQLDTLT